MSMTERENALRVITKSGQPEWVPCAADCYDVIIPTDVIRERPTAEEAEGDDWFGCYWKWDPGTLGFFGIPGDHPVKDITKWRDQVAFPDIDKIDWKQVALDTEAKLTRGEKLSNIFWESGPWERYHALVGFEEALIYLYTEPEAALDLLNAITDYKVALVERIAAYYKPDIITNFDDFGHQTGQFISTEMFRKFILPMEKRIGDAVLSNGIIYSHHSCGKIDAIMGDILDTGATMILGLFAPYNDIEDVEKRYAHRFTVDGGLNNQLISIDSTTDDMIIADVRRCIDTIAPYCNLIVDLGIIANMSRVELVRDEVRSYGYNYWKSRKLSL